MSDETHDTHDAYDTMQIDNETYIAVADYARIHGANADRLRGMARDKKFPTARQLFGKWIVVIDTPVPPTTPRAAARADGRRPFTVYANDAEFAVLDAEYECVDPRAVSRARRATRAANTDDVNATD